MNKTAFNLRNNFKQLKIIFYGLAAGQLFFFLVVFIIEKNWSNQLSGEQLNIVKFIIPILILTALISSRIIYNQRIKYADKSVIIQKKFSSFKINNIVRWAQLESANILSSLAYLLTGYYLYAILSLILLLLYLINIPTKERFIFEYELTPDELSLVRNQLG
jgi:hypothetical protein